MRKTKLAEDNTDQNRPPVTHYQRLNPEPIDVINSWGLSFNLGNVVKYLSRAGFKEGNEKEADLKKAISYINFELEFDKKKRAPKSALFIRAFAHKLKIATNMYDVNETSFTDEFITPENIGRLKTAIDSTWNYIGYDMLQMSDGNMSRDDVEEVVFDANHLEQAGDMEIAKFGIWLQNYRAPQYRRIRKQLFPYASYGY